jgi:hypothetical protein
LAGFLESLFSAGTIGFRGFLAWTATFLVFVFCTVVVVITIRSSADFGRQKVLEYYRQPNAKSLFGLTVEEERKRAEKMVVWPLGYVKPNVLLLAVLFGFVSLYLYRIGLYVTGAVIGAMLVKIYNRIRKWGHASDS